MSPAAGHNSPVLKQQNKQKIHKSKQMNKCQASRAASHLTDSECLWISHNAPTSF